MEGIRMGRIKKKEFESPKQRRTATGFIALKQRGEFKRSLLSLWSAFLIPSQFASA